MCEGVKNETIVIGLCDKATLDHILKELGTQ